MALVDRRQFIVIGSLSGGLPLLGDSAAKPPKPIPEPHFPSRLHLFVWRNWELANTDRLARLLRTTPREVLEIGYSMGLPDKRHLSNGQLKRLYITVIRQNWHVLPEEQLIELLGWDREKFAFHLKEDDFLSHKLGPKPRCRPLFYRPPSPAEKRRAAEIRGIVERVMGAAINERGEDLFAFVKQLSEPRYPPLRDPSAGAAATEVDLSGGWRLAMPEGKLLGGAARRFQRYLAEAMGARVPAASGAASPCIRMKVKKGKAGAPDGFRIEVDAAEVRITGRSESGVLQGIYFLQSEMERRGGPFLPPGRRERTINWDPRYLYSYSALYGDPLLDAELDPFPDAYLEKLARNGINGVWMQAVLNKLAPSEHFPEFGAGAAVRLENLKKLVERCRRFDVRVYLYLNEPRAMPAAFFEKYPETRGRSEKDLFTMCTSVPVVREWLAESLAHVMKEVPELGGFFTITMSENLTNCFSHGGAWGKGAPQAGDCPRCSKRQSWDVLAELIRAFRDGIRRQSSTAQLINWDWGWGDQLARRLIPLLPRDTRFLSISEWSQPVERGGVKTAVGEYSISVVGPGPRARRNWALAARHEIPTMAKVQWNNTWEIAAVPYIPVPQLIARHAANLSHAGIGGLMASWTCGGYPSPNLATAHPLYLDPAVSEQEAVAAVARRRYGHQGSGDAVKAWERFSTAFQMFPYGVAIYTIPTQHGPANPLRLHPTGYRARMILFPYDDWKHWSGAYPPETVRRQFSRMAAAWKSGLDLLRVARDKAPAAKRCAPEQDLAVAETCYHHFQSVANQLEFCLLREALSKADAAGRRRNLARMKAIAEQEIELARRQFLVARRHSTIGYEASNHYFYTPLDLVEKVLNCRHIIDYEIPALATAIAGSRLVY